MKIYLNLNFLLGTGRLDQQPAEGQGGHHIFLRDIALENNANFFPPGNYISCHIDGKPQVQFQSTKVFSCNPHYATAVPAAAAYPTPPRNKNCQRCCLKNSILSCLFFSCPRGEFFFVQIGFAVFTQIFGEELARVRPASLPLSSAV